MLKVVRRCGWALCVFLFIFRSSDAFSETPNTSTPSCDEISLDDESYLIRRPEDLRILSDVTKRRLYVPSDSRFGDATIVLTGAGYGRTVSSLECVYANKSLADSTLGDVARLVFDSANDWVVDSLSITGNGDSRPVVEFRNSSSNNVLQHSRIANFVAGIIIFGGSNGNIIANNTIEKQILEEGNDRVCIGLDARKLTQGRTLKGTEIRGNSIRNCIDGVQLIDNPLLPGTADFSNTLIEGNHIWINDEIYTNCEGRLSSKGNCACAENAIDIKSGGSLGGDIVVRFNRVHGFRKTDPLCAGSGSWGAAIVAHFNPRFIRIEGNAIYDSARGIAVIGKTKAVALNNNLIFDMWESQKNTGFAVVLAEKDELGRSSDTEMQSNIIINSEGGLVIRSRNTEFNHNLVVRSEPLRSDKRIKTENNLFVGRAKSSNPSASNHGKEHGCYDSKISTSRNAKICMNFPFENLGETCKDLVISSNCSDQVRSYIESMSTELNVRLAN